MRYWWVNQNQTYTTEVRGNFMWSPKANANGARNPFYDFMREVAPDDIVFSFCDTRIKALGARRTPTATCDGGDCNFLVRLSEHRLPDVAGAVLDVERSN